MAIKVRQEPLYVFIYGPGSEVMHTSNYGHHVRVGSDRITFFPFGTRRISPQE